MFQGMYNAGVKNVVVFDRVGGETPEQETAFLEYFAKQLEGKGLPDETITKLKEESRRNGEKNKPLKVSELKSMFEANGYRFKVLRQNPDHAFTAYRVSRIN